MSSISTAGRRQGLILIAVALAALVGFFFIGRGTADDAAADPAGSGPDLGGEDQLPSPTELALAGRTPKLIAPKPPEEKPANRTPAGDSGAQTTTTTTTSTTEEVPVTTPTETTVPAPPPPAPTPTPEPPPPNPQPSGGSGSNDPPVNFDDSG